MTTREETETLQRRMITEQLESPFFSSHSPAGAGCDMTPTTDATADSCTACRSFDTAKGSRGLVGFEPYPRKADARWKTIWRKYPTLWRLLRHERGRPGGGGNCIGAGTDALPSNSYRHGRETCRGIRDKDIVDQKQKFLLGVHDDGPPGVRRRGHGQARQGMLDRPDLRLPPGTSWTALGAVV
jgi:hypothetical protein